MNGASVKSMSDLMVAVPAGCVLLGSPEDHLDEIAASQHYSREWFEDESPQHQAEIGPFWIDARPVTNAQYLAFCTETGYLTEAERRGFGLIYGETYWLEEDGVSWRHPGGPEDDIGGRMDHPVVHVAHADAAAYARWAGKRLPTEAEWEYAAHGPAWRRWPWGDNWDPGLANCAEHWYSEPISDFTAWHSFWAGHRRQHGIVPATTSVGSFSPAGDSPFGIADLAGNVSEWTDSTYVLYDQDRTYHPTYHIAAGRYKVLRGGSWMNFRHQLRTSERFAADPAYSSISIGFRCASTASPAR